MQDFDTLLTDVSGPGRYQVAVVVLLIFPNSLMNAFARFLYIFQFYQPDHCCRSFDDHCLPGKANYTTFDEKCVLPATVNYSITDGLLEYCRDWKYDRTYFDSTAVTQWNLVCGREIYRSLVVTVAIAVSVLGSFPFSFVQDKFGRRQCFLLCLVFYQVGHVSSLFAPSILWFMALRSISSLVTLSLYSSAMVWALEFVDVSKRMLVSCLIPVFYGIAACILALIAWLCNDWINLGLVTSLPFLILFLYPIFIDESPGWLFAVGKKEKAVEVLKKIASWENQAFDADLTLKALASEIGSDCRAPVPEKAGSLLDFLLNRSTCLNALVMATIMSCIVIGYNAINFNVEKLSSMDLYISFMSQSIMETFGGISLIFILGRYGRVWTLFFMLMFAGHSFLLMSVVGAYSWVALLAFQAIAKYFIVCSFSIAELLINELLPTGHRAVGFGFTQSLAETSSLVVPLFVYGGFSDLFLTTIILGIFCIVCSLLVLMVPETKDTPLPETIEDCTKNGTVGITTFLINTRSVSRYLSLVVNVFKLNASNSNTCKLTVHPATVTGQARQSLAM